MTSDNTHIINTFSFEKIFSSCELLLDINLIESMKTMSMETVSTGVLDKNKEHYLRSEYKAEKSYDL